MLLFRRFSGGFFGARGHFLLGCFFDASGLARLFEFLRSSVSRFQALHLAWFKANFKVALDARHLVELHGAHQRDRFTRLASPSGSTDAMDMVVAGMSDRIINDEFDILNIQPAGSDIRGYQNRNFAITETAHDLLTNTLGDFTVNVADF